MYTAAQLGLSAPSGGFQLGGWYQGRQYNGQGFGDPGVETVGKNAGNAVSKEVVAQTNPDNVSYIEAQRIQAPSQTQVPYSSGATSEFITGIAGDVEKARKALVDATSAQKTTVDAKLEAARLKETETLGKIEPLVQPFREDLETTERERLYINENFEANQKLVDELDTLLTEGNDLIRQQQEVTGLAAVRNPRIQKSMDDVAARAGVIEAVINARNGQISVAENMIDRTVSAITADRNDQISYYETILELNNRDIISLDSQSQKLAQEQLDLKKFDLENAQKTADYVKQLLIDPATAQLVAQAGVKLTDSVETINTKLAKASYAVEVADLSNKIVMEGGQAVVSPKGVPADELRTLTDSQGVKHYFRVKKAATVGTQTERSISGLASTITSNKLNFPDAVWKFANQMSLSDIYSAYSQSDMGQNYGLPSENPAEVADLYKVAKGEMTEAEYNRKWNKKTK